MQCWIEAALLPSPRAEVLEIANFDGDQWYMRVQDQKSVIDPTKKQSWPLERRDMGMKGQGSKSRAEAPLGLPLKLVGLDLMLCRENGVRW